MFDTAYILSLLDWIVNTEVFSPGTRAQLKGAVGVAGQGFSESSATSGASPRHKLPAGGARHFAGHGSLACSDAPPRRTRPANPGEKTSIHRPTCSRRLSTTGSGLAANGPGQRSKCATAGR